MAAPTTNNVDSISDSEEDEERKEAADKASEFETKEAEVRKLEQVAELEKAEKEVLAEIEIMDSFSAHGDRNEMYQFIAHQKSSVKKVFLVHGEPETIGNFKSFLTSKGFGNVMIPNKGEMAALSPVK